MRPKLLAVIVPLFISATALAGHGWRFESAGPVYGSIAYSPSTGKIGWSHGYDSPRGAEHAAIDECGIGDCTWRVREQDKYAVLAVGDHGGTAVAWNDDLWTAERDAIASCNAVDTSCTWRQWVYR
jgi:hypothetical protein